jgi:hypothetical protein
MMSMDSLDAACSVCGEETSLYLNGVPICPDCDKAGKAGRAFAGVREALTLARQECRNALAAHSKMASSFGLLDPGNPAATEAIRNAYARIEAASLAYAKALRDYRAFKRE